MGHRQREAGIKLFTTRGAKDTSAHGGVLPLRFLTAATDDVTLLEECEPADSL
jgi:hypothetical protein